MSAGRCFYCSNPINGQSQTYIVGNTVAYYKHGGQRPTQRHFHRTCFDKFIQLEGRPYNPDTLYEVTDWWEAKGDWTGEVHEAAPALLV